MADLQLARSVFPLCGSVARLPGVHFVDRIVMANNKSLFLSGREAVIFGALFKARPRVAFRERLYQTYVALRPIEADWPDPKIIDVYICHLRRKLAAIGLAIETVHGDGYRLVEAAVPDAGIEAAE